MECIYWIVVSLMLGSMYVVAVYRHHRAFEKRYKLLLQSLSSSHNKHAYDNAYHEARLANLRRRIVAATTCLTKAINECDGLSYQEGCERAWEHIQNARRILM